MELRNSRAIVTGGASGLGAATAAWFRGLPPDVQDGLAAEVAFPHRLGDPSEFARLCAHIVGNGYLNGEVIRLDGALRMR